MPRKNEHRSDKYAERSSTYEHRFELLPCLLLPCVWHEQNTCNRNALRE